MATIEEVYDDPDDLPLPSVAGPSSGSAQRRGLQGDGMRGALLEEIGSDDDLDMARVEEQSRGQGDRLNLPLARPPRSSAPAVADDAQRPSAPAGQGPIGPNLLAGAGGGANPMAGMMSDLMKIQEAEEAKMRKLEAQMGKLGNGAISGGLGRRIALEDTKRWYTLYPIFFDAKRPAAAPTTTASTAEHPPSRSGGRRRVARNRAVWWPQSWMIAKAAQTLGIEWYHELEKTHPSDWRNPGRVRVNIEREGRFFNPIIKNRTQLYNQIADQIRQIAPDQCAANPTSEERAAAAAARKAKTDARATALVKSKKSSKSKPAAPVRPPAVSTRIHTPAPPYPRPAMDERYPLTSPAIATGVAVSSVKRDVEAERDAKKKGVAGGGQGQGQIDGPAKEAKMPKMKKVVVRKR